MTKTEGGPPWYFRREGEGFVPSKLARNPWYDDAVAGGPTASLIAHVIEQSGMAAEMEICRITIDILGVVPSSLLTPRVTPVRIGRQAQVQRVELLAGEKVVAQAQVLLARYMDTPEFHPPSPYPDPDTVAEGPVLIGADMAGAIRTRPVQGSVREPGRGIIWFRMDGEVVQGITPSPFVKACIFADFGNGVGSSTRVDEWSYANMDVDIHFMRMPRGEWFLLEAHTEGAGNGHALAQNIFADRDGVFGKGSQTVFVAPSTRVMGTG
jgi:acyl-coenzyme A thioesterase PaaI-like protein